jgi:glutamine synthetase
VDGETLILAPDLETLRSVPWDDSLSIVLGDLHDESGAPSAICSRSALRRAVARVRRGGYEISAAAELEFFLVNPETRGPVYSGVENYSLARVEYEPVLAAIRNELRALRIPVEASNPEYSGGQFEINIAHGSAVHAADHAMLLRHCGRQIARRAGFDATFMAKPWSDQAGSGLHVHQSLWRDGTNAFYEEDGLSGVARAYLAGLLDRMPELALFGSPTPNGYHRRADFSFSPTTVCWGGDNRTVAVRAVTGQEAATRIEQRDACADCNVYLAFAGQFLAGLDGIQRRLEPPDPVEGNAYEAEAPRLPRTFLEAYELLDRSAGARQLLGAELVDAYLAALAPEVEIFVTSASDWERRRYAEVPLA